jgi:hypothetical protein
MVVGHGSPWQARTESLAEGMRCTACRTEVVRAD